MGVRAIGLGLFVAAVLSSGACRRAEVTTRIEPGIELAQAGQFTDAVGKLNLDQGDLETAISDFTAALRRNGGVASAYRGRAAAFLAKDLEELALADLDEAIDLQPESREAYTLRAAAFLKSGNLQRSIADAIKAVRLDPGQTEAYETLARCHARQGQVEEALKYRNEVRRLSADADHSLSRKLAQDLLQAGHSRLTFGDDESAKECFECARDLDPDLPIHSVLKPISESDTREVDEQTVRRSCEEAERCAEGGQWDEAIARFTEAIAADNESVRAQYGLGLVYLEKGLPETALACLSKAIHLDSRSAEAYCQRARAHLMLNNRYMARSDCTQAILLRPGYATAHHYRGLASLTEEMYELAIADFEETRRIAPANQGLVSLDLAEALRGRGRRNLRGSRWQSAIDDFTAANQLDPENEDRHASLLADAYRESGLEQMRFAKYEAVEARLKQALELAPRDSENYAACGLLYYQQKDWDRAIWAFEECVRLSPERKYRVWDKLVYATNARKEQLGDADSLSALSPLPGTGELRMLP